MYEKCADMKNNWYVSVFNKVHHKIYQALKHNRHKYINNTQGVNTKYVHNIVQKHSAVNL